MALHWKDECGDWWVNRPDLFERRWAEKPMPQDGYWENMRTGEIRASHDMPSGLRF